jgi:hypothetical protein
VGVLKRQAQVLPGWIRGLDQRDLLLPGPAFQFFFTSDRVADVLEEFKVDQAIDVVERVS